MLVILLIAILVFISIPLVRNLGAKRLFNVPWYYRVVSLDIGGVKGK